MDSAGGSSVEPASAARDWQERMLACLLRSRHLLTISQEYMGKDVRVKVAGLLHAVAS